LPQAELVEKGLYRAPDFLPKFEKMLSCFDVLISAAKQGQFGLDPEPELTCRTARSRASRAPTCATSSAASWPLKAGLEAQSKLQL
jgi:hypothetical protein